MPNALEIRRFNNRDLTPYQISSNCWNIIRLMEAINNRRKYKDIKIY